MSDLKFRVIVLLPLHTEGNLNDSTVQTVMYYQRELMKQFIFVLKERGVTNWNHYISFHALEQVYQDMVTMKVSLLYVHSKMMIVDDRFTIIGSANINERSMSGSRDTEIAAVINSPSFARELRLRLWNEHTGGIAEISFRDGFAQIKSISRRNTDLLMKLFDPHVDSRLRSFAPLKSNPGWWNKTYDPEILDYTGHLVDYPFDLLSDELSQSFFNAKNIYVKKRSY